MERFWEVTREGVKPIMCNFEDLRKSESWLLFHVYEGRVIFENYSRAMLCWYEKSKGETNCFTD